MGDTTRLFENPSFIKRGSCRNLDPSLFYAETGDFATAQEARNVCALCPVCPDCLEFALRTNQTRGIWGGTNERERRQIRSQRAQLAVQQTAAPKPPTAAKRRSRYWSQYDIADPEGEIAEGYFPEEEALTLQQMQR